MSLLSGWLLDAKGPRITAVTAYTLVTVGLVLAGIAARTSTPRGPHHRRHSWLTHETMLVMSGNALYPVGFGVIAVGSSTGYMAVTTSPPLPALPAPTPSSAPCAALRSYASAIPSAPCAALRPPDAI